MPKLPIILESISNDLKGLKGGEGSSAIVASYYPLVNNLLDGGGGNFYWTTDVVSPDDGGNIIVPTPFPRTGCWKRYYHGPVSVKWFGAKGDGVTDDTAAIQAAINSLASLGGIVFFPTPPVVYRVTDRILLGRYFHTEQNVYDDVAVNTASADYLAAIAMPFIILEGEHDSAIWGNFTSTSLKSIIYYGLPAGNVYKHNSEQSGMRNLVVHGNASYTPGSPPTIVPGEVKNNADDSNQVGICVPYASATVINQCTARYCKIGFLQGDNYWSTTSNCAARCCKEGFNFVYANAARLEDLRSLVCWSGFVISGQGWSADGLHTENCPVDIYIPSAREFSIYNAYLENLTAEMDAYAIILGNPHSDTSYQLVSGIFDNIHIGSSRIPAHCVHIHKTANVTFRNSQLLGGSEPAIHCKSLSSAYFENCDAGFTTSGINAGLIGVDTGHQSWALASGQLFTSITDFEVLNSTKGIILRSPNNTRYRITVDNAGALSTAVV